MSSFELALPWILTLTSGLVLVPSFALLRRTIGRDRHERMPAPVEDMDAVLNRIEAVRTKLSAGRLDNDKSGSATASSRRPTRDEAERNQLADRIRDFNDLLDQWRVLVDKHLATAKFESYSADLRRLEDDTRTRVKPVSQASKTFALQAVNVVSTLLPMSDRAKDDLRKEWQELDPIIRRLAESAGLVLIEPRVGETLNRLKHQMSGVADGSQRGSRPGNEAVSRVYARGLEFSDRRSGEQTVLPAEVEVRF